VSRSDKTEKATPQRRREARTEGNVAKSQEIGVAASLLAAVLALKVFGGSAADTVREETHRLFSFGVVTELPGAMLGDSITRMVVGGLVPFLAAATVAALVAGFAQVGFKPALKAAKPKFSHLSLKKGVSRFKPVTAGWELVRSVIKLGLLAAIVWNPVSQWAEDLAAARGLEAGLERVTAQSWTLLLRVVAVATLIGAADYGYNRWKTARDMKMSKDEVKREHKSSDGDPMVKGQRRRRQMEMSRNRMLGSVASADVVVTNPTHIAIALRYGPDDGAPRVIARGADRLAAKIRKEAYRHGVPVTRDVPLARALYRQCKVGQHVPAALYEAVATVLAFAYRRRGLVPGHAGVAA
jgi:flagellar biosynthetic protein FlhB